MRSLSEILLPTDFSPRSADVAPYVAGVARHFNSRITLLHVLRPINLGWSAKGDFPVTQDMLTRWREDTLSRLRLFLRDELQGLSVRRIVIEGDPAEMITDFVVSDHVGLIMMPTRGCRAFRRFLLGSVTAKVLHDVNCPVWTSSHTTDGHPVVSAIPETIVCAIDPAAEGEAILHWASDLAADLDAHLIVVHAIPSLDFHPETYFLEADWRKRLIGEARSTICKLLQNSRTPAAEVRIEGGNVSTVVRSVVEDSRADLLIIGRASGSGMFGRLRTHSYALIRESPCPVISI